MKRAVIFVFMFSLVIFNAFCTDYILSGGFETAFGFKWLTSLSVKANGHDYSKDVTIDESNKIIAPGANLMLRIQNPGTNKNLMLKFRFLFLSRLYTDLKLSSSNSTITAKTSFSNTYSDFNQAFFIDLSGGWTILFPMGSRANFLIDVGPSINFAIANSDSTTERIFSIGSMGNFGFDFTFGKHLNLETGLNLELLLSIGGRSEPGLSINGAGVMLPISPYINIGYKF